MSQLSDFDKLKSRDVPAFFCRFKVHMKMLEDLSRALALMLVFEGIMPFLMPDRWLRILETMVALETRHMRALGLTCMLVGCGILLLMR